MEERKLNEKESLELITRMMQNTKMNLERGSGNTLIILGISTFIANAVVCALLHYTQDRNSFWAWMLIPVIALLWMKLSSNSKAKVTTKIDKMVNKLWINISIITVLLPLAFYLLTLQTNEELIITSKELMSIIPFAEMLLVSIGLIANAIIIDFKPLRIGGLVGALLSLCLLCDSIFAQSIMFGVWAITSMIVPGIKLNHYIKSKKNV